MKRTVILLACLLPLALGSAFALPQAFTDVDEIAYYYDPLRWAYEEGIASGVSDSQFGVGLPCTREDVVLYLWRAYGSPSPSGTVSPFVDVPSSSPSFDAVMWAFEGGITTGSSADTFDLTSTCTRAQVATFLWRAAGTPPSGAEGRFTDVPEGAYFEDAVEWATAEGITHGSSENRFSPDTLCTHEQILTFLFRSIEMDESEVARLLDEQNSAIAVVYLGVLPEGDSIADAHTLPGALPYAFLADIPAERRIVAAGSEVYAIIPKNHTSSIAVHELDTAAENYPETASLLYDAPGSMPILVQGNQSDIMPNLSLTFAFEDQSSWTYSPYMSLVDGSLGTTSGILDLSLRQPPNSYTIIHRYLEEDENTHMAMGYLGFASDDAEAEALWQASIADFPFLVDAELFLGSPGTELYLLIPERGSVVRLYAYEVTEENGFAGSRGELLYEAVDPMSPILLRCNVSDIMPNVQIEVTPAFGEPFTYEPMMSLQDGTLQTPGLAPFVLDLTRYG